MQVDVLLCIMISPLILILELYGLFFCTCTVTTITQTLDLCNSFFLRLTQIYMCCLNLSRTTLVLSMQLRWEFWLLGVDEGGREGATEGGSDRATDRATEQASKWGMREGGSGRGRGELIVSL